jgi:hypothetical protein
MFFRHNKEKETGELKLSDFHNIWTKFCFLDETGSLASVQDPYFSVGMIKMSQPYYLQSKILYERNVRKFYDEMKFNKLSKSNISFAKFAINAFLDTHSIDLYTYTTRKDSWYYKKHFNNNQWVAYENITIKLLEAALAESEVIILIADHVTTPKDIRFEVSVKKRFNLLKNRLALAGVCRFDSRSNDLLQIVDLLIGCITYDLKYTQKIVQGSQYKLELVDYLKENIGTNSFQNGFKKRNFNIFIEKDQKN